jgi:PleD family two-component response regulator
MSPANVLVVDSHINWLGNIQKEIQDHTKLRCVPLTSCKDLLNKVKNHNPAVIVLNASSTSWATSMVTLRNCEDTKTIPLVVVSDKPDEGAKDKAYTNGCIDFIVSAGKSYKEVISKVEGYGCLGLIDIKLKKLIGVYK